MDLIHSSNNIIDLVYHYMYIKWNFTIIAILQYSANYWQSLNIHIKIQLSKNPYQNTNIRYLRILLHTLEKKQAYCIFCRKKNEFFFIAHIGFKDVKWNNLNYYIFMNISDQYTHSVLVPCSVSVWLGVSVHWCPFWYLWESGDYCHIWTTRPEDCRWAVLQRKSQEKQ